MLLEDPVEAVELAEDDSPCESKSLGDVLAATAEPTMLKRDLRRSG